MNWSTASSKSKSRKARLAEARLAAQTKAAAPPATAAAAIIAKTPPSVSRALAPSTSVKKRKPPRPPVEAPEDNDPLRVTFEETEVWSFAADFVPPPRPLPPPPGICDGLVESTTETVTDALNVVVLGSIAIKNESAAAVSVVLSHVSPTHWNDTPLLPGETWTFACNPIVYTVSVMDWELSQGRRPSAAKIAMLWTAITGVVVLSAFVPIVLGATPFIYTGASCGLLGVGGAFASPYETSLYCVHGKGSVVLVTSELKLAQDEQGQDTAVHKFTLRCEGSEALALIPQPAAAVL